MLANDEAKPPYDEREIRQKAIDKVRDELAHLFDGLIIIGTFQFEDGGYTGTVHSQAGNWHAQNGMLQYVLRKRMAGADLEAADQHETE